MANFIQVSTFGSAPPREDPGTGQAAVDHMIRHWRDQFAKVLPDRPDLIVTPECCDRFACHSTEKRFEYYARRGTQIRDVFSEVAAKNKCYIAYPAAWQLPDGTWRNRCQILDRNGDVAGWYDKNHLVVTEHTEGRMEFGTEAKTISCDFGSVAVAICFDLNFVELLNRYAPQRPDLLLFCSMYHGGLMQSYWAYQCRAHMITACAGLPSAILSPVGEILATTTNYFGTVSARINLDCRVAHLDFNWERLDAMKKKYGPGVRIHDPGHLASVLLSSELDGVSMDDLVKEFGIERLDDYLARSRAMRAEATADFTQR